MVVPRVVDAALVDEGFLGLCGQDLALLLVHADVGIGAHGHKGHHHVQLRVRTGKVEDLGCQALLGNSRTDEQIPQLVLGLPGRAHGWHVEPLVVAKVNLGVLA